MEPRFKKPKVVFTISKRVRGVNLLKKKNEIT
jgi:hypothetical protein